MEELKTIETVDTSPFKHLVMTLGELPTSFVDSMTYYECLAWLVNFIQNTVIPTVNNNAEAVEELQTAFVTLKNFVDNYFDNLDVQDEINNKLDEMVESGEFQEIISQLLMHHFVPVENYGAVGDGTTDDTQAIQTAINNANENSVILFTKTYKTTDAITISNKKLILAGGGVIKPLITGNKNAILTDSDIVIKNITIDGSLNPQDQFDEHTFSNLVLLTGLYLQGENSIIENVTLKDIYGYGIRFRGYKQIAINNCRIDSVGGHWYQNNDYDSFGDAIYLGGTTGDSYIEINNTIINGKYKNTTLSRCGICVENLTDMVDGVTNIKFTQGTLDHFDRIVHVESIQGYVKCDINNVDMMGNCFYSSYSNSDKLKLFINKSTIEYTNNSYNGTFGIRGIEFNIQNSSIECGNISLGFSFAKGTYTNCIFNNIVKTQFSNASDIKIYDSTFNIGELTQYLNYSSNVKVFNSTFNKDTDTNANRSASAIKVYSCIFNKYIPHAIYEDTKSIINMSESYTLNNTIKFTHRLTTFKVNNVIQFNPNLCGSIEIHDISKDLLKQSSLPANQTIPLIPTFDNFKFRPNSRYAVINIGTDDYTKLCNGMAFNGVYLNIITTNNNGTVANIGTTEILGNENASFKLTIDTANQTVARSGTYAYNCGQLIIDVKDLDSIATYTG